SAGSAEAIPSSIHARLKFKPSRCASFGSLGSGETVTGSQLAVAASPCVAGICGRKSLSHLANSSCDKTRRITSASPRQGERKSSPEGSLLSGQSLSARKNFLAESATNLAKESFLLERA